MSFAERLFTLERRASIESPSTPLSSLLGGAYGENATEVNESSAMGLTAYWRAVNLIASSIAMLPLRTYRKNTRTPVLIQTVLDNPSQTQTPFEFWQTWGVHQLSWGNAYGYKIRDGAQTVRYVNQIHPSRARTEIDDSGDKVFLIRDKYGRETRHSSFDVAHLPFLSVDGISGMSALQACRQALASSLAAEQTALSLFENGTKLSGLITTDAKLNEPQSKNITSRWREKFSGPSKAGEVAVLDNGAKFVPLSMPPEDAQLLQSRQFTVAEIARIFGVPSHFLNDQEKATAWGSGIESMGIGYVIYTLMPRIKATEQRITRELLPGGWETGAWDARFDLKALLRGDAASRAAFYRAMMDMKVMTNVDIAELEDMDAPEHEAFLIMSNYTMVDPTTDAVTQLAGGQQAVSDPGVGSVESGSQQG